MSFTEENKVKIVAGARLEVGHEMKMEVAHRMIRHGRVIPGSRSLRSALRGGRTHLGRGQLQGLAARGRCERRVATSANGLSALLYPFKFVCCRCRGELVAHSVVNHEWLEGRRRRRTPCLETPISLDGQDVVAHTFVGDAVHQGVLNALGVEGLTDGPTLRIASAPGVVRTRAAQSIAELAPVLDREAVRLAGLMPVAHRELSAPSVLVAEARASSRLTLLESSRC